MKTIYNIRKKNIKGIERMSILEMKSIIRDILPSALNTNIIAEEYKVLYHGKEYRCTLALDENYNICVIEYKYGYSEKIITSGLIVIDYIKENMSEFKLLFNDILKDDAKYVNYNARLIVFGDEFSFYDYESIIRYPYNISLIKMHRLEDDDILIEKAYVSKNEDLSMLSVKLKTAEKELFDYLNSIVLGMDDSTFICGFDNVITYTSLKTYMYLILKDGLELIINERLYKIKSFDDIDMLIDVIEDAYEKCK